MQLGFFDIDRRHAMLSAQGDPLERLNQAIDWELFRPVLAKIDAKAVIKRPRQRFALNFDSSEATDRSTSCFVLILTCDK